MDERTNKQTNERYMRVYFKRACLPMLFECLPLLHAFRCGALVFGNHFLCQHDTNMDMVGV